MSSKVPARAAVHPMSEGTGQAPHPQLRYVIVKRYGLCCAVDRVVLTTVYSASLLTLVSN